MSIERKQFNPDRGHDFSNEDEVRKILESGTEEELAQLQEFHSFAREQMNLYGHYAKLRREALDQVGADVEKRKKENPVASQSELDMGAYNESIESHVRDTVVALRGKGYNTTLSGFSGLNSQEIRISNNDFNNFKLDDDVINNLGEKGIDITVKPSKISFKCGQELSPEQLTDAWNSIEKEVPDLGHQAKESLLPIAESFRDRQSI